MRTDIWTEMKFTWELMLLGTNLRFRVVIVIYIQWTIKINQYTIFSLLTNSFTICTRYESYLFVCIYKFIAWAKSLLWAESIKKIQNKSKNIVRNYAGYNGNFGSASDFDLQWKFIFLIPIMDRTKINIRGISARGWWTLIETLISKVMNNLLMSRNFPAQWKKEPVLLIYIV